MNAGALRARFDAPDALGIGIEEELFLLDGETLDLLPQARAVLDSVPGDARFKLELPASQLEIVTAPAPDVHGVAAFAHGLIHGLAARHDAGEPLPVHDSWRIDENRWAAMRDGVEGTLADLETGERVGTRELLLSRLDGLAGDFAHTRALIEANGAVRTREVGVDGAAAYLADRF